MKHHWDAWLKTTLLWGIASLLVAALGWYFQKDMLFGIAAISFFTSIVHAMHKIIYSRPLNWKDRRKRKKVNSNNVQEDFGYDDMHWPSGHHHSSHDDIDIDYDSDFDFDFDYD